MDQRRTRVVARRPSQRMGANTGVGAVGLRVDWYNDDSREVRAGTKGGSFVVKIALVTDSNAQMPAQLRDRYGIRVAPLGITIDGVAFKEGVDISSEEFYQQLAHGAAVATSAASPGDVLAQYEAAAADGAEAILSIHIGSNTSATLNAVKVAQGLSPIPVTIVDTGTASFAIGCCVWAAADALIAGASIDAGAQRAYEVAAQVGNVFIVGALDLAERGGRLAVQSREAPLPVLALEAGQMCPVAQVFDHDAAVDAMCDYVVQRAQDARQCIGVGNAGSEPLTQRFIERLHETRVASEIVRYDIGPSVGAHTGLGTVGCVFFPKG